MGSPYQSQSAASYNASPPPDDGSTTSANKITWTGIKTKLADSIKGLADAINTQLRTALNVSPSTTSAPYTTVVGDHLTTIEVTGTTTISLGDAATMIAQTLGYTVTVYNKDASLTTTVGVITNTNKLNGQTNGVITLPPKCSATFTVAQSGVDYEIIATSSPQSLSVPRSYLSGLTLSTAGGSGTMSIAAGQASDSTNVAVMSIAVFTKTTSVFAAGTGNGGLDTGAIANTTWYHFYLIVNPITLAADILISLSATSPTLPTGYTLKRRIGSGLTDGSAHWVAFVQDGDLFQWAAPVQDISAANPGTGAVTRTLGSVPTGVNVQALLQIVVTNSGVGGTAYGLFTDLAINDTAATNVLTDIDGAATTTAATATAPTVKTVRTNTSAQIRSRLSFSDASVTEIINTFGWLDRRGRDA